MEATRPPSRTAKRLPRKSTSSWNSESQRRIYCVRLAHALRRTRPRSHCLGRKEVRAMADRVLAASARGASRWSRAIMTGGTRVCSRPTCPKATRAPSVRRRVRLLSRLVPGCTGVRSLPSLLEEAADYVSALEMQVKAMSCLASVLASLAHA